MKKLRTNLGMAGVLCVVFFIFTAIGFAQDKATLTGNVTDSDDGSPLPGANIVLVGTTMGAASSRSGDFTVGNIPPGTYTVRVSFIGYEISETADVVFSAGETITMNFSLVLTGIQFNPIIAVASRRPEKSLDAPASISVIELREINQLVAPSSASLLANVTGIDMATTGIDRREIVMRGFNNAFSGAAYILTDNRRAAVPSLDVNLHSIMPNMAIDLEKVEIVRGPGSALYGAGVDAGVIHYISKDPFTYPGTTFSFSGGERSSIAGHFRHAGVLGENVGYKITGQYAQADDWKYDPNDPLDAAQLETLEDLPGIDNFNRDYEKINVNGLLEFRLSDKTRLIANGGFSSLTATLLSGIGTIQADGYGYSYGQLRLQSGSFFAQAYLNKNDAGDSFVYGQLRAADITATPVVDKSIVFNAQEQYDLALMDGMKP
ncbi:TonB-dependent receptor [candidate division KSB1 bacterium]|nr:TonB-dependent receptor [candidate division KSB1 bacterium]